MLSRIHHQVLLAVVALAGVGAVFVAAFALRESLALRAYEQAMSEVRVIAPEELPAQDQESVLTALTMFSIPVPQYVDGPVFDGELGDRGLTTGGLILPNKRVTVGPAAFTSWGVLGSTLAHEIEVHVPQSFFVVVATDTLQSRWSDVRRFAGQFVPALAPSAKDLFENDGTWKAEREAYLHEIKNAKRFGLSEEEISSIWRVMDYFYPSGSPQDHDPQLSATSNRNKNSSRESPIKTSEL